ncbi:hypothetical protein DMENIID0001_075140 [Sergentomyia squamirostris]
MIFPGWQDTTRLTMGVLSSDLTTRVVNVIVNEIESWQKRLLTVSCSTSQAFNTAAIGEIVRSCSLLAFEVIYQLQDDIFSALEEMHLTSNEVATLVVEELAEFNIVTDYSTFADHFAPIITQYQATLNSYVDLIGQKLGNILDTGDDLPERTQSCMAAKFRKISNSC